jgi:hypothetical protein
MGKYFPISSDSIDDLIALNISGAIKKEDLFELSTLLPILAQWCLALNLTETYSFIQKSVKNFFPECTLQVWYPDKETDQKLYIQYAGGTGAMDAPYELDASIDEMKKRIKLAQKNTITSDEISSLKYGQALLPILASRHFRTPFFPLYWQTSLLKLNQQEN